MTDKTLQDWLRERNKVSPDALIREAADALDAQAERIETMKLAVEVAVAERDAAQERIKALEGALRDFLNSHEWDYARDGASMTKIAERARALLGEK